MQKFADALSAKLLALDPGQVAFALVVGLLVLAILVAYRRSLWDITWAIILGLIAAVAVELAQDAGLIKQMVAVINAHLS